LCCGFLFHTLPLNFFPGTITGVLNFEDFGDATSYFLGFSACFLDFGGVGGAGGGVGGAGGGAGGGVGGAILFFIIFL
jgi:hypothetical protein